MRDIKFPNNITVQKAIEIILRKCKDDYFSRGLYKGEEYYLCGGDCQACSVREILRFLRDITNKIIRRDKEATMPDRDLCKDCRNGIMVKFIAYFPGRDTEPDPTTEFHCQLKLLSHPTIRVLECSEFRRRNLIKEKKR